MQSYLRSIARAFLVAVLASSLINAPLLSASDKPLGTVVLAQSALLGNLKAVPGADVYSGDTLLTNSDGLVRLKMGENQFYLSHGSVATMTPAQNGLHATLQSGSAGFSAIGQQVEIETPVGVVRPAGNQRTFGQVTITGPNEMVISAYEGSLMVEGSDQTINAGQSYQVTATEDTSAQDNQGPVGGNGKVVSPYKRGKKRLLFVLILLGGTAVGGFFIYHEFSESCSERKC